MENINTSWKPGWGGYTDDLMEALLMPPVHTSKEYTHRIMHDAWAIARLFELKEIRNYGKNVVLKWNNIDLRTETDRGTQFTDSLKVPFKSNGSKKCIRVKIDENMFYIQERWLSMLIPFENLIKEERTKDTVPLVVYTGNTIQLAKGLLKSVSAHRQHKNTVLKKQKSESSIDHEVIIDYIKYIIKFKEDMFRPVLTIHKTEIEKLAKYAYIQDTVYSNGGDGKSQLMKDLKTLLLKKNNRIQKKQVRTEIVLGTTRPIYKIPGKGNTLYSRGHK